MVDLSGYFVAAPVFTRYVGHLSDAGFAKYFG
jgi:hypothetical protein